MKTFILSLVLSLSFCGWFATSAHADVAPEKQAEIEKMLKLTGMEKLMDQMKVQMISSFKSSGNGLPDSFWENFEKKMNVNELLKMIIPIYDKHYSVEEIKAINAFYESPIGKKVLATLPAVMEESMKAGQEWGAKIAQQVADEVEKAKK